jgi:transposase-like protein
VVAVRWYLRYGLSYRDVEELLAERGIEVDHVTVYRWVQRFAPLLADAARFARHAPGDRWFVDETYVKVGGVWRYVYRAIDQRGQVIDVLVSARRDAAAARWFFTRALRMLTVIPSEVVTDAAPVYPGVLDDLVPSAWHHVEQYATTRSRPITASSSVGYDRCAAYRRIGQHRWSSPGTPSCRTCNAATTNSDSTPGPPPGLPQRSPSLPERSESALRGVSSATEPLTQQTPRTACPTAAASSPRWAVPRDFGRHASAWRRSDCVGPRRCWDWPRPSTERWAMRPGRRPRPRRGCPPLGAGRRAARGTRSGLWWAWMLRGRPGRRWRRAPNASH